MGDLISEYTELLQQQELRIQTVSAEIEALKTSQNPSSARLEEAMEECSRLKYRFNILSRALQKERARCGHSEVN
ncbi:unnamed protein product [Tetraodon nigroviridis]|uniref:(spotted green pufferfish) hypothetical protein n=1 Tax=Tetraodon nigroviridis TaxID=99883 RepID=Q4SQ04_TETNG|nr:unnamed protein product [Tetraodon nigroviridis]